jgi:hypothetical protein
MTARAAFEILRRASIGNKLPSDVNNAIGVALDHVLRLEQTLDLIGTSISSALEDKPANAVLSERPTKKGL